MDWKNYFLETDEVENIPLPDLSFAAKIVEWGNTILEGWGLKGDLLIYTRTVIFIVAGLLMGVILWWITRRVLIEVIHRIVHKSKTKWDDHLVKNKFLLR